MSPSFSTPIVSPVLVGREAYVVAMRECVAEAVRGTGRTVLIAGEAGIGKSRLLAEAIADAQVQGVRVLIGHCFEPDRTLPYAPILDLLRTFLLSQPPVAGVAVEELAPEIVGLMPEMERRFPAVSAPPSLGPEQDTRRRQQGLLRFFARSAAEDPLIVVIEDAHWSDEASLDVLLHLARQIGAGCPLALLVTYRSDEPHPALATMLATLDRERLATELRLGPLSFAEVETMLAAIGDRVGPLPGGLGDALYALSEGNPFFVEELVRSVAGAEGGDGPGSSADLAVRLPRSVEDSVQRRLYRLSPGARETLSVAAVCGRRFDFALLEALSGCDEGALVGRVKELVTAQLVVEESADRFAFRHTLTREAIASGLLARERRTLHREIAEAIQRAYAGELERHAADLALHWHGAGAWAETHDWATRAGEQALALYAPRAAVEHLTRAVDAAAQLGLATSPGVYLGRGQAFETLGDFDSARADFEAALAAARMVADPVEECSALLALGLLCASHDYKQAGEHFRAALVLSRRAGDAATVARSLNRMGNWHVNAEQPFDSIRYHEEALSLFEDLGDRRGIAETLDLLGMTRYLAGDQFGSIAAYRRAIELLRELGDRQTLTNSLAGLALTLGSFPRRMMVRIPGSYEESYRLVDEATRTARGIGWRPGEAYALCCAARVTAERHPGRALAAGLRALRIAEEIGHRQWFVMAHSGLGEILTLLRDLPAARQHLEAALACAREIDSVFWTRRVLAQLGSLSALEGDFDRAAASLDAALGPNAPMETIDERMVWCARIDLALASGNPSQALTITERLMDTMSNDEGGRPEHLPALEHLRGEALAALGRGDEAETALRAVAATAEEDGLLPLLWSARLALGNLARGRSLRDGSEREFALARAAMEAFAAEIDDEDRRQTFLQYATGALPVRRPPSQRQAAKAAYGGLTERERDVAVLVARGLTNPEIAEALFISRETARTHVGNILSKLGLKSRAQIAAWVQEHGLSALDSQNQG